MVFNLELFKISMPFIAVVIISDAIMILYLFLNRKIVHSIEKIYYKKLIRKIKKLRQRWQNQ